MGSIVTNINGLMIPCDAKRPMMTHRRLPSILISSQRISLANIRRRERCAWLEFLQAAGRAQVLQVLVRCEESDVQTRILRGCKQSRFLPPPSETEQRLLVD